MPRLTIEFPEEGDKILKKLAAEDSTSKREVIRRALALYNYLHEEGLKKDTGKRLSITDKEGEVLKDILF